jgi:microcystin-dependent protein
MANPFVGEIRIFAGNFPPQGWAFCDGNLLPIAQYEVLFNLIGTTYGGDGQTTFALPDLRGRVPVHQGSAHVVGQIGGSETVTLQPRNIPVHSHAMLASTIAVSPGAGPTGVLGTSTAAAFYGPATGNSLPTVMAADAVTPAGSGQPHSNMAPFLAVTFIISLFGIFPSQA